MGYLNSPGKARLRELTARKQRLVAKGKPVPTWLNNALAQGAIRYPGGFN